MLPNNLPVQLTRFVGREREIAGLKRLVLGDVSRHFESHKPLLGAESARARLLTLTGVGGCGKTRLAIELANTLAVPRGYPKAVFKDGIWFIPLASITNPALVAQAVVSALELQESPDLALMETLVQALRSKNTLLLLDNCEHLSAACARLAETLLQACPDITLLATSRGPLNLAGEALYPVPPLEIVNPNEQLPITNLVQCESVRLFVDRATAVQPHFALTEQNARAVTQICQWLDGIPLAIELAAARVKTLTPQQISERLGDVFQLLRSASPTGLPRHQNLRAAFDWSYDLLTEPERTLFRRLAVFSGGWMLNAAEQVTSDERIAASEVLGLHERLLDQALIERMDDGTSEQARYRMLEPVRQYAMEWLRGTGEEAQLHDRHLEYYTNLAGQAGHNLLTPNYPVWLKLIEADIGNIRSAMDWSMGAGDLEQGLRMAVELFPFWLDGGYIYESIEIFQALLESPKAASPSRACAKAQAFFSLSLLRLGDHEEAMASAEAALAIERLLPDDEIKAYALAGLGHAHGLRQNYTEALAHLKQSLALFRALDHVPGQGWTLSRLGTVALYIGDHARAEAWLAEGANLMQASNNLMYLGYLLRYWSFALLQGGHVGAAQEKILEEIALSPPAEIYPGVLAAAGAAAIQLGQIQGAVRLLGHVSSRIETFRELLLPYDLALYKRNVEVLRARLGESAFDSAWETGRKMTIPQAYEEAVAVCKTPTLSPRVLKIYPADLTGREVEVLRLVALGFSNQEIADQLVISRRTVHAHLRSIFDKLGVTSRTAASREANRMNLT